MLKKVSLLFVFCTMGLVHHHLQAQTNKPATTTNKGERIYQLSGLVLSKGTQLPISYARLFVKNKNRFGICNEEGFFSIAVLPGDTLTFSRVGYKRNDLVITEYLKQYQQDTASTYIYAIQYMVEDTLELPTVTIYPYNSASDLKYAILNMDKAPLGMTEAQTNISPELMAYFMENLPENETDRINVARRRYLDLYTRGNMRPNVTLVDPVAIYNLIRYVSNKSKAKKEQNYKYSDD